MGQSLRSLSISLCISRRCSWIISLAVYGTIKSLIIVASSLILGGLSRGHDCTGSGGQRVGMEVERAVVIFLGALAVLAKGPGKKKKYGFTIDVYR